MHVKQKKKKLTTVENKKGRELINSIMREIELQLQLRLPVP